MTSEREERTSVEILPFLGLSQIPLRFKETPRSKEWRVLITQSLPEYSPPQNPLEEILKIAKNLPKAQRNEEREIATHHRAITRVIVENWSKIVPHLYPLKHDLLLSESSLVCVPEVSLRALCRYLSLQNSEVQRISGKPDFVGLGPDGTIFVGEVGTGKKRRQIETYLMELTKILPRWRIIGLIAYSAPKGREISLRPVSSF